MLPRLWTLEWGGLLLHLNGYGFSVFCGALAALLIVVHRAQSSDLPLRPLLWIFTIGLAGGFAGAKLAFLLQYGRLGGAVLYGGLLGGLAAGLAVSRRFGLSPLAVADLAAPCVLLAAAFGRMGCFFAGCCFGTVCDVGLSYPVHSHAWKEHVAAGLIGPESLASLPTVPAPLLEAGALLIGASLRLRAPGRTLAACGMFYASWRFAAEFWRGDNSAFWGPLTFSQGISVAVLIASATLWFRRPRTTAPSTAAPSPRFAWAQMGALLLLVGVATGSIGCTAKERRAAAKDAGDAAADCIFDCIGDCISSCIDDCTERNCNGPETEPEQEPRAKTFRERPKKKPLWFALPRLEPGKRYVGRLSIQGTVNSSDVSFAIAGGFQPGEPAADGSIETRIEVSELDVKLGLFTLKSAAGELTLVVDAQRKVSIRNATLSPETLSVLKALEPVSGGFLSVVTRERPAQNWSDRVAVELNTTDGKAECWATLTLNEETHSFRASGTRTTTATGERRFQWLLLR